MNNISAVLTIFTGASFLDVPHSSLLSYCLILVCSPVRVLSSTCSLKNHPMQKLRDG